MRSCLLGIQGNLNSNRFIKKVLDPEVLPLLHATPHSILQQDNARPHVVRIVEALKERWWYHYFPGLHICQTCHPWTCLECSWLKTCSSWSSSNNYWHFVDSNTNYMKEDFPEAYPSSLWFHAMMQIAASHRSCAVLCTVMYLICSISVTCIFLSVSLFQFSKVYVWVYDCTCIYLYIYYSVREVSDLIFFWKPGEFQWSALEWDDLETSYIYQNFFPACQ